LEDCGRKNEFKIEKFSMTKDQHKLAISGKILKRTELKKNDRKSIETQTQFPP